MENGNKWQAALIWFWIIPLVLISALVFFFNYLAGILVFIFGYVGFGLTFTMTGEDEDGNNLTDWRYKTVIALLWAPIMVSDRFLGWVARWI